MNKLLKRSLTGLVYVGIVCFSIGAAWYTWFVLSLVISFILALEFSSLMQKAGSSVLKPAASIASLFFLSAVYYFWLFARTDLIFIGFIALPILYLLIQSLIKGDLRIFLNNLLVSIYVSFPLAMSGFLILMMSESSFVNMGTELFHSAYRPALLLSVFAMIWVFDSFAYLIGIAFGKHKMAPRISPKKSWEGFLGGLIFLLPTVYLLQRFVGIMDIPQWLGVAIIVAGAGTLGDLFISQLKRMAGAKDSGTILPGHGGLLDRFDSFLLILPLISLYIILIA